ncbi:MULTISPECIES: hypothetical protein [unclassified Microcoleus]|uniref:hypothetical protein n=1 Tax=unclassified Microcoleus TaxID=2642155 RepID=UPI002FD03137
MPVTVNVGEILDCDQNDEIRTRGCDPCVGLIVIYVNAGNTTKRCAHFSVNIAGVLTQDRINAALNPILDGHFPLANIQAVGFTWGGGGVGMGSAFICVRLQVYFVGQPINWSAQNDSLTTNGGGIELSNGRTWAWTNDPPLNGYAELS